MTNPLTGQPVDWTDLGKVARHYGKPAAILGGGIWWLGLEASAAFIACAMIGCALTFIPFWIVHRLTGGR